MNCPQCQTANRPGSAFCGNCGVRLATAPQQPGWQYPRHPAAIAPASFDLNRLATVDKVVAGATLASMISIWLPWFSASASLFGDTQGESISGAGYHDWLWLEFILALALLGYLAARALWERLPFTMPVAHAPLLIVGTGTQFLLMLIAFADVPSNQGDAEVSVTWSAGAFLGLIASIVAAAPVIVPAVRSYLDSGNGTPGSRPF